MAFARPERQPSRGLLDVRDRRAADGGAWGGAGARSLLRAPQPPPIEAVLATLVNELSVLPNEVVLVLDDYHVVDARDVQDGMAFLLDHLPPRLHLVLATRTDPALPLAHLRARGELVEIRAADLRFTPDAAAAYLTEVMELDLAAEDISALEERTEGWIAALQVAALSVQGRDDVTDFIAGFARDDRYIVDYLVEEVLQRQPERAARAIAGPMGRQWRVSDCLPGIACGGGRCYSFIPRRWRISRWRWRFMGLRKSGWCR